MHFIIKFKKRPDFRVVALFASLAIFSAYAFLTPAGDKAGNMAAITLLMAILWITEAIPLATTALLPLVLYPLMGVMPTKQVASQYMNSTIFLFVGGFLLALAMEKWNLHRRIALRVVSFFGSKPQNVVLGFMIAAATLSMWVSNTATALIMLPVGLAILNQVEQTATESQLKKLSLPLLLGIAYACSVGGIATFVGTPPNLVFQRLFQQFYPDMHQFSFGQWMAFALPLVIVMLFFIWFLLTRVLYRFGGDDKLEIDQKIIHDEYKKLGRTSFEEWVVMVVFSITALLWIFRRNIDLGSFIIPGWADALGLAAVVDDGTIAIAMSLFLFVFPSRGEGFLLDKKIFARIPWHIVLLFGGGFALASGVTTSGLDKELSKHLDILQVMPLYMAVLLIALAVTFLTEFTSNTASIQMLLPLLAAVSAASNINPLYLMLPATLSASMAFMMPVATPPNTIVFGSDRLHIKDMARTGLIINLVGAVLVTLTVLYLAPVH